MSLVKTPISKTCAERAVVRRRERRREVTRMAGSIREGLGAVARQDCAFVALSVVGFRLSARLQGLRGCRRQTDNRQLTTDNAANRSLASNRITAPRTWHR